MTKTLLKQQHTCFPPIPNKVTLNSFQGKNELQAVLILKRTNPSSPALKSHQDQTVLSSWSWAAEQQKFDVLEG